MRVLGRRRHRTKWLRATLLFRTPLELTLPLLLCLIAILITAPPNEMAAAYIFQAITHQAVALGYSLP